MKNRGKVINKGRKQSGTKDRALGDPRRGKPQGGVGKIGTMKWQRRTDLGW